MQAVRVSEEAMKKKFQAWCDDVGYRDRDHLDELWNAFLAGAEAHYEQCDDEDPGNEE